jgi:hypothetical protein
MDMVGIWSTPDRSCTGSGKSIRRCSLRRTWWSRPPWLSTRATLDRIVIFRLAVGYEDVKVIIINDENAEELFNTKIIDFGAPITAMHWQNASVNQGKP